MKVQKHIEVRLLKKRLTSPAIDLVQYDTGIQLVFSLVDFDIPSGTSATLYVQKRSGKFVYQEKDITISGNTITIDLENQALTEHGETKYQITLKNGTDTVTTFAGVMRIEKSLADANAVESKTVVRAFDETVADHVAEFQTKAEQIVQACIATIPDDFTKMETKVNELANSVKGNLSGSAVFADDVSPVEHNPSVWVHGKNLISLSNECDVKDVYYSWLANPKCKQVTLSITDKDTSVDISDIYFGFTTNGKNGNDGGAIWLVQGGNIVKTSLTVEDRIYVSAFLKNNRQQEAVDLLAQRFNVQLEYGANVTDYESWIDPTTVALTAGGLRYTPNIKGIVSGISSTVLADGISVTDNNVIVECEYNRDTNKVIEKLTNAIIALGGTV